MVVKRLAAWRDRNVQGVSRASATTQNETIDELNNRKLSWFHFKVLAPSSRHWQPSPPASALQPNACSAQALLGARDRGLIDLKKPDSHCESPTAAKNSPALPFSAGYRPRRPWVLLRRI
jgi:hypothetical protein